MEMMESQQPVEKSTFLQPSLNPAPVTFAEFAGWTMPAVFSSIEEEVAAVRNRVGLLDMTYEGAMQVTGKEAVQFLQGLLTNDVKQLAKGKGMRAAFLTGHGKIRALCRVLGLEDGFLLLNDPQTHEKVFNYVFPFSYAGDFFATDVSDQHRTLSLQGQSALDVLKEVCFEPVTEMGEFDWRENVIADQKVKVVRHSRAAELGFDILTPAAGAQDVWDFLLLKGEFHALQPIGLRALDILRIEAGLPVYGRDLDEGNMLLESGLDDVVSFSKGCYTGQEAVAMATYRGHVSKRLSAVLFDAAAELTVGDKLLKEEKEVGVITSLALSPTLKQIIGLSCVKYGFFDDGTNVQVKNEKGVFDGQIIRHPLQTK